MARGALGAHLSFLLELNVIYTAGKREWFPREERGTKSESGKVLIFIWLDERQGHLCVCVRL